MEAADAIIVGKRRRWDDERRRHRKHRKSSNDIATQSHVRLLPLLVVVIVIVMVGGTFAFTSSSSSSTTRTPFVTRCITPPHNVHRRRPRSTSSSSSSSSLCGGYGIAESYSWKEDQFELEISVNVPRGTSASDVSFKCASDSIDMRLLGTAGGEILMDGTRKLRGKVCVDGTYWSIDGGGTKESNRTVTVTIEKSFVPSSISSKDGTITYDSSTIFDWGGVYVDDVTERNEVTMRKYDEPVELDVREYASTLGVDIGESCACSSMYSLTLYSDGGV